MALPSKIIRRDLATMMPAMPSPLAKQPIGGLVDSYDQQVLGKGLKRRGITVISPTTTTEALAYTNGPFEDCLTPAFDRPDFNQLKLRPRYDGQSHRLPEGDAVPRRIK